MSRQESLKYIICKFSFQGIQINTFVEKMEEEELKNANIYWHLYNKKQNLFLKLEMLTTGVLVTNKICLFCKMFAFAEHFS